MTFPAAIFKKMHILMIEYSGKSGMYSYTDALCDGLAKIGVDVTVLTSTAWPDGKRSYNVERKFLEFTPNQGRFTRLHWAADRLSRSMTNILRRNRFTLENNFDVVHIQGAGLPLLDQFFLKPLVKKMPVVLTVHDCLSHYNHFVSKDSFMRKNLHIPDRLIVLFEKGKKWLSERWEINDDKIDVIPHGIMPVRNQTEKTEARRKLDLPEDRKIILFFGSIRPNKGLDVLLKSMQDVIRFNPYALLLVAGALPRGESFESYSLLIEKFNLSENIKTFIEFIPDEDVDLYFSTSDIVVLPYLQFESQSGVLFRAYAHKKPVITSNSGAMGEIVYSDKTGEVAESGNVKSLASAINKVLKNLKNYQSSYTPDLENKYDWERIGRQTLQSYEKAISQKKKQ